LVDQAWNQKDGHIRSPNVLLFIEQSNKVSMWVANAIITQENPKKRKKVLRNMIMLCYVSISFF